MILAHKLSDDELNQVGNLIATLPRFKEVYVADIVGDSIGETACAVLKERKQQIKVHTICQLPEAINWTRKAVHDAGVHRQWSGILRNPQDQAFKVDALLISGLSNEATLAVLSLWVPYMRMNSPVWVHDADAAVESYIHIRRLGRAGRGVACIVRE